MSQYVSLRKRLSSLTLVLALIRLLVSRWLIVLLRLLILLLPILLVLVLVLVLILVVVIWNKPPQGWGNGGSPIRLRRS